jgi:hypothetical protein
MPRPAKRQALIRQVRDGQPVARVEVPRATCLTCGRETHVVNGELAYHLRPSGPQDDNFDARLPTMSPCTAGR